MQAEGQVPQGKPLCMLSYRQHLFSDYGNKSNGEQTLREIMESDFVLPC